MPTSFFAYTAHFLVFPPPSGQVDPRGPELVGQLQDHDPRAVHRARGAEGSIGAAQ